MSDRNEKTGKEMPALDAVTEAVLGHFFTICSVPHGSGQEAALAARLKEVLAAPDRTVRVDEGGNLLVDIPALPGREGAPLLVLQGHLDMVCAVRPGSAYEPARDPIVTRFDRDPLSARAVLTSGGDSSLGADCGLGDAAILWLFARPQAGGPAVAPPQHGPVRLVLTTREETGLGGALELAPSTFEDARYVINVDGFTCGKFVAGSAGGRRVTYRRPAATAPVEEVLAARPGFEAPATERVPAKSAPTSAPVEEVLTARPGFEAPATERVPAKSAPTPAPVEDVLAARPGFEVPATECVPAKSAPTSAPPAEMTEPVLAGVEVALSGFTGGHSGFDIHKGRVNAPWMLGRFLDGLRARGVPYALASWHGGTALNAIPSSGAAVLALPEDRAADFRQAVQALQETLRQEYGASDGAGHVTCRAVPVPRQVFTAESADALVQFVAGMPVGVTACMEALPGVPDTSLNLGILHADAAPPAAKPADARGSAEGGAAHPKAPASGSSTLSAEAPADPAEKTASAPASAEMAVHLFLRSMGGPGQQRLEEQLVGQAAATGFSEAAARDYPAWAYREDNRLPAMAAACFADVTGTPGRVEVEHVGLEPAVFCAVHPALEMVCMGADILDPHSIHERVMLDTIAPFARTLRALVERISEMREK